MNLKIFFTLLVTACSTYAVNYTLIGPKKFRPGTEYKFSINIYGSESVNYRLEAKIVNEAGAVLVQNKFNIKAPGLTNVILLRIPKVVSLGSYVFHARATGDVDFNVSHALMLNQKTHSLFIQTDKFLYKPGQTVLFRVLGVESDLKPYISPINITIYDHSGNKIYQLLNQKNDSGVINGHLKLTEITSLGQWKIEATTKPIEKEVFFRVAEYVLPKYEVKVILPNYYYVNNKNPSGQEPLQITVIATYTFGKPVKGYALITIKLEDRFGYRDHSQEDVIINKHVELVDGKADIAMPFQELKKLYHLEFYYSQTIFVQANVTEAETGVVLQGNSTVPLEFSRYLLKFLDVSSSNFKPVLPYRSHIQLSQVDGSEPLLSDIKYPNGTFKSVELRIYANDYDLWNFQDSPFPPTLYESIHHVPITESGYMFFEVPILYENDVQMTASFYDEVAHENMTAHKHLDVFLTRDKKFIQLSVVGNTGTITPGSALKLNVRTSEFISLFQCQILGKGGILYSNSYPIPHTCNNITFEIPITKELALNLAPEARLVATFVSSTGELVADSLALSVSDYLSNKVTLSFNPDTTSPGEEVVLRVNTSENSYVSLLAVDQSVLLLSAGNDISQKMLYNELQEYTTERGYTADDEFSMWRFRWPTWLGGSNTQNILDNVGVFVLTNFHISQQRKEIPFYRRYYDTDVDDSISAIGYGSSMEISPSPSAPTPRKNFPETWIWSDLIAESDGSMMLKYKVPDTITSWMATAFATNSKFGLGISETPAKVTVIKPFFISLNLPYSIVRGEQFALQATVFNYYGQDLMADITLPKSNYFQVKDCINGEVGPLQNEDVFKRGLIHNNDMDTFYFWIVPTALGQIPLEVKAFAGLAADSMIHNLLVKPEGWEQSYSSSALIRLPSDDTPMAEFDVTLPGPDVLVPDSIIIEATLIGDVMGTTINNLDKLLKMPYGCGEQNMLTLAPDVYIVKYLTATDQLTDDIKTKAMDFINKGYQRELTYQRSEGSFSAFGETDEAGSVWLSAFVIKVFHEAKYMIPFEDERIAKTLTWILQHQNDDGSFSEPPFGKVLHTEMQGGSSSGISLAAYVLISLLANKDINVSGLNEKIALTVSYLERHFENHRDDPYILSITAYALYLAESPKLPDILGLLNSLAVEENGMKYWHKAVEHEETDSYAFTSQYMRHQSNDIEMTSYVLLIYASQKDLPNSIPIAKWLISKRNSEGGFVSTQDTVLGLEALAHFGEMVVPPVDSLGLTVHVTQDANDEVYNFDIVNRDSALFLQSHQLPSNATKVTFSASGEGMALVQLNVRYYTKSHADNQLIKQIMYMNVSGNRLDLKICVKWLGDIESGMVLTEVNLLTGFIPTDDYKEAIKEALGSIFKKAELSNNRISIYLDELTLTEKCFVVKLKSVYHVKQVKPALVKTYRYYAPEYEASGYYCPTSAYAVVDACSSIFNKASNNNNQALPDH